MPKRTPGGLSRSVRRSGDSQTIWTTIQGISTAVTASTLSADIVLDADWAVRVAREGATILSIRGWMACKAPTTAVDVSFAAYIGLSDENAGSGSPQAVATYNNEDVMFTYGHLFGQSDIVSRHWEINVGAMRKIKTGTECRLNFIVDVTAELEIAFVVRALLKINNS